MDEKTETLNDKLAYGHAFDNLSSTNLRLFKATLLTFMSGWVFKRVRNTAKYVIITKRKFAQTVQGRGVIY